VKETVENCQGRWKCNQFNSIEDRGNDVEKMTLEKLKTEIECQKERESICAMKVKGCKMKYEHYGQSMVE
jgi:hypothetical protein